MILGLGEKLSGFISIIFLTSNFQLDKIDSSLLVFFPKKEFFYLKNPKSLEKVTQVFFSQRRKMIKKPFNQIFKNAEEVSKKLGIDLNLRPQNLTPETYYKITKEYENLRG